MKNKTILTSIIIFTLIAGLFILTGCNNNSNNESALHKISFVDLKYDEVKNFSKKEKTLDGDDYKAYNYFYTEDENKNIKLIWYKNKDESILIDSDDVYQEKNINGINWKVIRDTDFEVTYDTYCVEHNGDLYIIELNAVDKYESEFDEFMNSIEF